LAARMPDVGCVTVSLRRSTLDGLENAMDMPLTPGNS
jgi:hypothetical protein